MRRPPAGRPGAAAALRPGLRRGPVRPPARGDPPRPEAGQHPGHGRRRAEADRLRDRQADRSRPGRRRASPTARRGGRADADRRAGPDAGIRQPRAGPGRAGHDGQRRLCAGRGALPAPDGPPALSARGRGPTAEVFQAICEQVPERPSTAVVRRPARAAAAPPTSDGRRRAARRPRSAAPATAPDPRGDRRGPRYLSGRAQAGPGRRPRRDRADGDAQGAGAAVRLGRAARRRPAPLPRRPAGAGAGRLDGLSRGQVRAAARGGGRRRAGRDAGAGGGHRRHDLGPGAGPPRARPRRGVLAPGARGGRSVLHPRQRGAAAQPAGAAPAPQGAAPGRAAVLRGVPGGARRATRRSAPSWRRPGAGSPGSPRTIGSPAEAADQFEQAVALWETCSRPGPAMPEYREELARTLNGRASVLMRLEGRRDEALAACRRARELIEPLAGAAAVGPAPPRAGPGPAEHRADPSSSRVSPSEAIETLGACWRSRGNWPRRTPARSTPRIAMARAHGLLGQVLAEQPDGSRPGDGVLSAGRRAPRGGHPRAPRAGRSGLSAWRWTWAT